MPAIGVNLGSNGERCRCTDIRRVAYGNREDHSTIIVSPDHLVRDGLTVAQCGPRLAIRNGSSRTHRRAKANFWRSWSKAAPTKKIAPIGDQRRHHQEPHAQHSVKSAASRRGHAAARRRFALQSAVTPITGARHARCRTGVPRSFGRVSATVVNLPVQPKWPRRQC